MSHSTTTKHTDTLKTQSDAENDHNSNSSLITNESIEGTPYRLVGSEEKGYWIGLNKFKVLKLELKPEDHNQALMLMENRMWELITNTIATMIVIHQADKDAEKNKKEQNK